MKSSPVSPVLVVEVPRKNAHPWHKVAQRVRDDKGIDVSVVKISGIHKAQMCYKGQVIAGDDKVRRQLVSLVPVKT